MVENLKFPADLYLWLKVHVYNIATCTHPGQQDMESLQIYFTPGQAWVWKGAKKLKYTGSSRVEPGSNNPGPVWTEPTKCGVNGVCTQRDPGVSSFKNPGSDLDFWYERGNIKHKKALYVPSVQYGPIVSHVLRATHNTAVYMKPHRSD